MPRISAPSTAPSGAIVAIHASVPQNVAARWCKLLPATNRDKGARARGLAQPADLAGSAPRPARHTACAPAPAAPPTCPTNCPNGLLTIEMLCCYIPLHYYIMVSFEMRIPRRK